MKTKHEDIVAHWANVRPQAGICVPWDVAVGHCWRCGYQCKPQRCHIIPSSLGGQDSPINLVLLCATCHAEAPNVPDDRFMWLWIERTCQPIQARLLTECVDAYQRLFGREALSLLERGPGGMSANEAKALALRRFSDTSNHFSQGRTNAMTMACALYLIEEEILVAKAGE